MSELFIALRCEELPARFVASSEAVLVERIRTLLSGISHGSICSWSTPRRLAVSISDVESETPRIEQLVTGPPADRAFKDDQPTKAAIGFARGRGVDVADLEIVDSPRGPVIAARIQTGGESTYDRIAKGLPAIIMGMPFPKKMSWGKGEHSWARPIQGLIALLDGQLINCTVAGIDSSNRTTGHRLSPATFPVTGSKDWLMGLRNNNVEADPSVRRQNIEHQLNSLASEHGLELGDLSLIEEVLNLVEYPVTIAGTFPEELLDLPPKLLVESMRVHQRVFPSYNSEGNLSATFFAVTNQPNAINKDVAQIIANGNKRVLTARFYDAKFFYAEDRNKSLEMHAKKLEAMRWVRNGGTMQEKSLRISVLAQAFANRFGGNVEYAKRAGLLCKADLGSQMVGEFPKLQGHVGSLLAGFDGEEPEVAQAIEEHYLPRFHGDQLPETQTGLFTGMADRWDTLTGCFRLGLEPKGSGDPLGLRRAANGFLLLCLHGKLQINLKEMVQTAECDLRLYEFLLARLRAQFQENHPTDFVNAVLSTGDDNPVQLNARLKALNQMSKRADFIDFRTTFKRVLGLCKDHRDSTVLTEYFEHKSEVELYEAMRVAQAVVDEAGQDFAAAFDAMASLRPFVNAFFEGVMVMVENEKTRDNRLSLLRGISNCFRQLADFTLLSSDNS
jgi:glycyl-tRNA synthetase beta chain